jgi:hypothetical protein
MKVDLAVKDIKLWAEHLGLAESEVRSLPGSLFPLRAVAVS